MASECTCGSGKGQEPGAVHQMGCAIVRDAIRYRHTMPDLPPPVLALRSAVLVAIKNLEATELAGLPSIAHVIKSLKAAINV